MSTNHTPTLARPTSARQIRHPRTACVGCGDVTRATDSTCRTCRLAELETHEDVPLTGGASVPNGRGVSVWVAA